MDWDLLVAFGAGLVLAALTAPVGVSGAVFLLPVQQTVLGVPNPAVTPTNLLFNVIAAPGALARYRRSGPLLSPLVRRLLAGTIPGVVLASVVRVFLLPGPRPFRIVAGAVLLGLGVWLLRRTWWRGSRIRDLSNGAISGLALVVGVVGGVYGIGGGSILSPMLVGSGLAVSTVAPAALVSTLLTSVVGAATYAALSLVASGPIAPDWPIGLTCGVGRLLGAYLDGAE